MKITKFVSALAGNCPNVFSLALRLLAIVLLSILPSGAATRHVNVGVNNLHNFVDVASATSSTTINAGDTVQWDWVSGFHSTTSGTCSGTCTADGKWDSGAHSAPSTFSFTFNSAGTFAYYCSVHLAAMTGKVIVNPVVTNTADSGAGSLRQAILDVNADPDLTTITFSIPGGGVQTITLASALPAITNPVLLDGYSQSPTSPTPVIELNGSGAGSATGLTITGGNTTVRGLVIHGFSQYGILVIGNGNNTIAGNFIGTNASGTAAAGNGDGILIQTANNTIGGTLAAARNLISGNAGSGINLNGAGATANQVLGNYIGTNAAGVAAVPNSTGISLISAGNNTIGGTTAGMANVISGNTNSGIDINSPGASNNLVEGNFIGVNSAGTATLGNNFGVRIAGSAGPGVTTNNTIGGTAAGAGNVVSGNNYGVFITGPTANNNIVVGNFIGTNAAGTAAVGNAQGVQLGGGTINNSIGGTTPAARNLISGNFQNGVLILSSGTNGNLVQGNLIGVDVSGSAPLGNGAYGVTVDLGAANNVIGGTTVGSGNTIAYNQKGVVVITNAATGNAIEGNTIFSNTVLGIDLGNDGVTNNTPGGPHAGPNNLQNYPVLSNASACDETTINGTLNSTPNTAFRVEFFSSPACGPSGHGQGQILLGSQTVSTDGSGNASFSAILLQTPNVGGQSVTATATDPGGNTSEFSQCQTADYMINGGNGRNLRVRLGKPFTLVVASFADSDPNSKASDFSGTTINWGDGTAPTAATVVSTGGQNYNVIGTHVYNRIGGWNVTVNINDSGGTSGTVTTKVRLWPRPFSY
ncbi:MAG TPA: plastocyanin/azurin family copper-binding protein [Terriglobales bacterium]|nr:plastocyanin/azurin family copper-binding protein [Terriglobales bacterium]